MGARIENAATLTVTQALLARVPNSASWPRKLMPHKLGGMAADHQDGESGRGSDEFAPAALQAGDVEVEREGTHPSRPSSIPRRARRDAALAHVRKFGDPVLRATALPVERFDERCSRRSERMGELMHDALGVGLAATQLGVLHRMLVSRPTPTTR